MEEGVVLFYDQQDVELGRGDEARQPNALHRDQRPDWVVDQDGGCTTGHAIVRTPLARERRVHVNNLPAWP